MQFSSLSQEQVFDELIRALRRLGYKGDLLQKEYEFADWFDPSTSVRTVPVAAFAQTPCSYNTACFAVVLPNGLAGDKLVNQFRALGAPLAFEVYKNRVVQWTVSGDPSKTVVRREVRPDDLGELFDEHKEAWSGLNLLRAKNIGIARSTFQGDLFVDSGLVPALESHIRVRLDHFLKTTLAEAEQAYFDAEKHKPDDQQFFRLAFRLIAAKVLRDRGVGDFPSLDASRPKAILRKVEAYYEDSSPALDNAQAQEVIASRLWNQVSFANLSVEVLAYIYEHTFVDSDSRRDLGIHGTPHSIARYIVYGLPFEEIPEADRLVVEPCCGHGIFLVAALQRLRELLPPGLSGEQRHEYFKQRLYGFDLDPFAIEVAKLSLILSDFPSGDDWRLFTEDVFASDKYLSTLRRARIVLCNPPFGDFNLTDPGRDSGLSPRKPARLLQRVLETAPQNSLLGFVLPRVFLDGASYKAIRNQLAERYEEIEVLALPDKIFTSDIETALLLCKQPSEGHRVTRVSFAHVPDSGRQKFLMDYMTSGWARAERTPSETAKGFKVLALPEVWQHLRGNDKLHEAATVHRGIEWQPPFDEEKYISAVEKPGFKPGVFSARGLKCFLAPPTKYLDTRARSMRGSASSFVWHKPKVLLNASRVSRGPWCVAAFADTSGLIAYQDFTGIWPHPNWSATTLAAVLNGPVASAFVSIREDKLHIRKVTLNSLPMPKLTRQQKVLLDRHMNQYIRATTKQGVPEQALEALLKIDSIVLQGYNLPPPLERQLLEIFRWEERPIPQEIKDIAGDYIESLIKLRLADQLQILEEDEEEQRKTGRHLQESLAAGRLSFRRLAL